MTKVKSISIEGLNQTPIADKALDEAQTQSSVAATDCIPLKGADGNIHKIRFDSFLEAVSSGIAALMNNTNKGQTLTKLLGLDANGAAGVSSLADAAAMLGNMRGENSNILLKKLYSASGLSVIGTGSVVTIIRGKPAQCILICGNNGPAPRTPSIFVISREKVEKTIYEGFVETSAVSVDTTTGNISVSKNSALTLYYRLIEMEA